MTEWIQIGDGWVNTNAIRQIEPIRENGQITGVFVWVNGEANCLVAEGHQARAILQVIGFSDDEPEPQPREEQLRLTEPEHQKQMGTSVHSQLVGLAYQLITAEEREQFSLTSERVWELQRLRDASSDLREKNRARAILLLGEGIPHSVVSEVCGVSRVSVSSWLALYCAFGIRGICSMSEQDRSDLIREYREQKR